MTDINKLFEDKMSTTAEDIDPETDNMPETKLVGIVFIAERIMNLLPTEGEIPHWIEAKINVIEQELESIAEFYETNTDNED